MPELPRCVNEGLEEEPNETDSVVLLELVDVDHRRTSQLEQSSREERRRSRFGRAVATFPAEDEIELLAERVELSLRIDHELLHLAMGLLKQPSNCPRLPAARVRLQEHPGRDESVNVQADGFAFAGLAEFDGHHARPL